MTEVVVATAVHADAFGAWRCGHGPCPVRTVSLRVRAGVVPPALRCPLCLRTLTFAGWVFQPVANCRSPASPSPGTM